MQVNLDQAMQQLANKILAQDPKANITRTAPEVQHKDLFIQNLFDFRVETSDNRVFEYAVSQNMMTGQIDTLPIVRSK